MRRLTFLAVPIAIVLLAGCGSSSSSSSSTPAPSTPASSTPASSTPAPARGGLSVAMKNLAFSPAVLQAKVGQTITFTNDDSVPHNVTGTSGPKFTASQTFNNGGTFKLKLTQAGTINYFCTIHPFMKASIVVTQ